MRVADRRRRTLETPSQRNIRLSSAAKYLSLDVHDTCRYKHVQVLLECQTHRPHAQPLLVSTTCASIERTRSLSFGPLSNAGSCVGPAPVGSLLLANNVKHSTSITSVGGLIRVHLWVHYSYHSHTLQSNLAYTLSGLGDNHHSTTHSWPRQDL